ncbi:hypothetical protein MRX96_049800 [Rhipicephalus microplus]
MSPNVEGSFWFQYSAVIRGSLRRRFQALESSQETQDRTRVDSVQSSKLQASQAVDEEDETSMYEMETTVLAARTIEPDEQPNEFQ